MPFDLAGARNAGYSDEEIASHIASEKGFDLEGALGAGYGYDQILPELLSHEDEKGFLGEALDFGLEMPKRFGVGALDMGALFTEGVAQQLDTATNRLGMEGLIDSGEDNAAIAASRRAREGLRGFLDPKYDENYLAQLSQGLGSFASFLGASAITRGYGAPLVFAGGVGAGEAAERMERAKEQGIEIGEDAKDLSIGLGTLVGFSEIIPAERLLKGLKRGVKDTPFWQSLKPRLKAALGQASVEAVQESLAGIAQDAITKGLYDPNQPIGESLWQDATVGGGVGFIAELGLNAIPGKRVRYMTGQEAEKEAALRRKEEERMRLSAAEFGAAAGMEEQEIAGLLPPEADPDDPAGPAKALARQYETNLGDNFPLDAEFNPLQEGDVWTVRDQDGNEYGSGFDNGEDALMFSRAMTETMIDRRAEQQADLAIDQSGVEYSPWDQTVLRALGRRLFHPLENSFTADQVNRAAGTTAENKYANEHLTLVEAQQQGGRLTAAQRINRDRAKAGKGETSLFTAAEARVALKDKFSNLKELEIVPVAKEGEKFTAKKVGDSFLVESNLGQKVKSRKVDGERKPFENQAEANKYAKELNAKLKAGDPILRTDLYGLEEVSTDDVAALLKEKNISGGVDSAGIRSIVELVTGHKARGRKAVADMSGSDRATLYGKIKSLPSFAKETQLPVFGLRPYTSRQYQVAKKSTLDRNSSQSFELGQAAVPSIEEIESQSGPITQTTYNRLVKDLQADTDLAGKIKQAQESEGRVLEGVQAKMELQARERENILRFIKSTLSGYGLNRVGTTITDYIRQARRAADGTVELGLKASGAQGGYSPALNNIFVAIEALKSHPEYLAHMKTESPTTTAEGREEGRQRVLGKLALRTLNHESLHAMRQADLFTEKEWNILKKAAIKTQKSGFSGSYADWAATAYPEYTSEQQIEEAIAEMTKDGLRPEGDPLRLRIGGAPKSYMRRIMQFLKGLIGIKVKYEYESFDDLMEAITGGKIGARPTVDESGAPIIRTPRELERAAAKGDAAPVDILEQRRITATPAFKAWFGDSKVVDENGEPLVVYHGTAADISEFQTGRAEGEGVTGNVTAEWGAFFTPSRAEASRYATEGFAGRAANEAGANVVPAFLSIKNPYEMSRLEWDQHAMKVFNGMDKQQALKEERAFKGELQVKGYDGIVINGRGFNSEYVAFSPNQIKSAIGNRGTFDPESPDILESRRLPMDKDSRYARAEAMGFDTSTVYYHGTKELIDKFKAKYPDGLMFFTRDPEFASSWIKRERKDFYGYDNEYRNDPWTDYDKAEYEKHEGHFRKLYREMEAKHGSDWVLTDEGSAAYDRFRAESPLSESKAKQLSDNMVYPVFLRKGRVFDPRKHYKQVEDLLLSGEMPGEGWDQIVAAGNHKAGNWIVYENKQVVDHLKGLGYDAMLLRESALEGEPHDTVGVFNPNQIRSINAEFDPAKAESSGILESRRLPTPRGIVSTRYTSGKRATEDPITTLMVNDMDAFWADAPRRIANNIGIVRRMNNLTITEGRRNYRGATEALIDHMTSNLTWLWNQVDPEVRQFSRMWYNGANKIAKRFARRHKVSPQQAAAVIANMSPQKDWYMNASLAERVMDVYHNQGEHRWDDLMEAKAYEIYLEGNSQLKKKSIESNRELLDKIRGKSLDDLSSTVEKAMWIRAFSQTYHSPNYRMVSPEGEFLGYFKTQDGAGPEGRIAWGSLNEIGKAVSVLMDGSYENISNGLGRANKVRNFYNNIIHPDAEQPFVTIDTHAVAAALLQGLAGDSAQVKHNFGTLKGGSSSKNTGINGIYSLFEEAYRRAAREVSTESDPVLPREMQSVTWEAIRQMFPSEWKGKEIKQGKKKVKVNALKLSNIWDNYRQKRISLDEARAQVLKESPNVTDNDYGSLLKPPDWYVPGTGLPRGESKTSYEGQLPQGSVPRTEPQPEPAAPRRGRGDAAGQAPATDLLESRRTPDSPEFRRWFGDSKVVDENGDPLVVYHGTTVDNEGVFDTSPSPVKSTKYQLLLGSHFTETQAMANLYTEKAKNSTGTSRSGSGVGGQVVPVYLSLQNPADFIARSEGGTAIIPQSLKDALPQKYQKQLSRQLEMAKNFGSDAEYLFYVEPILNKMPPTSARAVLEAAGYDGVIYTATYNASDPRGYRPDVSYIAFSPSQIKSAIGNRGTYDPASDNILEQRRVEPTAVPRQPAPRTPVRIEEGRHGFWGAMQSWWDRNFRAKGNLPDAAFAAKIVGDTKKGADELHVRHLLRDFDKAVKAGYGKSFSSLSKEQVTAINDYLAAQPADVPEVVKDNLAPMRAYLDRLSTEMVNSRIVSGEAIATVLGNRGSYLTRSYQAFDDPRWPERVSPEVRQRAHDYLTEAARQAGRPLDPLTIDGAINNILQQGTAAEMDSIGTFVGTAKLGQVDLSMLTRRKDIAEPIRELLGEYKDPKVNFSRSATKMQYAIANRKVLETIYEQGLNNFLFENHTGEYSVQLAGPASEQYAPLSGLYTTPEIKKAFSEALDPKVFADWYRNLLMLNGFVKYGKTVLSVTTMARNFISATFFSMANGHLITPTVFSDFANASETLFREIFPNGDVASRRAQREYYQKLKRLGVTLDNPYPGEMIGAMNDAMNADLVGGKARQGTRKFFGFFTKMYQFGDDFWKIIGFESEKAALVRSGMSATDAEIESAQRIRDTYPTYSLIGSLVKRLRRFPLVGTFVSFPAEIIRTSVNIMRTLSADMVAGRKELVARRLVGSAVAAGWAAAITAITKAMLGLDDEDDETVRKLSAPWMRNSNMAYAGYDDDGFLEYFDLSYLDPYNYLKRPINALLMSGDWRENMLGVREGGGLRDILDPFIGPDIAATALGEIVFNKKWDGGKVYNEDASTSRQTEQIANHLRKAIQPGTAMNIERMIKASKGDTSKTGTKFTWENELWALGGFRRTTMNPASAISFRAFDFKQSVRNANQLLSQPLGGQNIVSEEEITTAFGEMMVSREKAYKEMIENIDLLREMGIKDAKIYNVLREGAKVSKKDVAHMMAGKIPPWIPDSQFLRTARDRAVSTAPDSRRQELQREFLWRKKVVFGLVRDYYQ